MTESKLEFIGIVRTNTDHFFKTMSLPGRDDLLVAPSDWPTELATGGIHMSIRGGWVWNLWGRACVIVRFRNGGTLRIGTDDAEKLAGFLEEKISG